ncbi:hypothetical protein HYH03_012288 [Edaphochlamys debaryana]|uniref:Cytochrome c domain-containing protein n=1 Tax=Edaphochlamys debaryana TaxID=47281 RepID=A0A836BVQ0_9CHLO|nr:hypothetical protein HYH03_012288 [Edaphochlamys debaryana]|eukprot:KAG2489268.1 hypothetical protein HYH03_012288 [Edaphochlamys debaryana]
MRSALFRTLGKGLGLCAEASSTRAMQQSVPALTAAMSSTASDSEPSKAARYAAALGGVIAGIFGASCVATASEAGDGLHAPHYHWSFDGVLDSYDHGAIRRGHKVYQQVCAACHSMQYLHWRQLVGVCYTEEEAKALAAETEVEDGPNDEGEMYSRPGRLFDAFPSPYMNEQHARFANGGAYPPDLSLISGGRHDGPNYIFSLLTGYRDPPAGISLREGLYYNPYFPGGAIAMPKMLVDGGVEYEDGTPSSASQQAKDVVTFLAWSSYPYQDEMRVMGIKACLMISLLIGFAAYSKRLRWAPIKSQRIVMDVVN